MFAPKWESPEWKSWEKMPFLAIGMDLGSDGVSAAHALQYFWSMNVECVPDPAHGSNRSVVQALRGCGVYPLILLWMIHVNLMFGPDREDGRYQQFRDHLCRMYSELSPHQSPLFTQLAPRIVDAFKRLGHEFSGNVSEGQEAWGLLRERAAFLKEGKRASMCRFQAISGSLNSSVALWPIHLLERSYVAIEEDFLHGKEFVAQFCHKHVGDADLPAEGHIAKCVLRSPCGAFAFQCVCVWLCVVALMNSWAKALVQG